MNIDTGVDSVDAIDCQYIRPQLAAAYLFIEGSEAAFVDNNTTHAVPLLLDALTARNVTPEQVRYLIVTHIHLDHSGGTAELLKHYPNATVLAHPRAARHLIDPTRLVASSIQVYGEEAFGKLYGTIEPIDEGRLRIMEDGEELVFGERTLRFLFTLGHARHHFVIHDLKTSSVSSGDSFGLAYPCLQQGTRPFIFCSSSPTEFDAVEARKSAERIRDTGAERVHLTHFGTVHKVNEASETLLDSINRMEKVLQEAMARDDDEKVLEAFCYDRVREELLDLYAQCGGTVNAEVEEALGHDFYLNSQGLLFHALRARKK